jgi:two-component system invasion response regulator UvrY
LVQPPSSRDLSLLIADDHPLCRLGMKSVLLDCPGVAVVDEVCSGIEVMKKLETNKYDCILLDIFMPGENGLAVLRRILKRKPRAKVIVFSMYPEDQYGMRALEAGALAYLTKVSDPELLKKALCAVIQGKRFIPPSLAEKMGERILSGRRGLPHERLSDREFEVMILIASGKSVSQIASELNLSVKTISTHRAHILEKMQLRNNAEITRYALRNGLVL